MLVRVCLLLRHPPLQRRIRRALEGLDVLVSTERADESGRSDVPVGLADIVIAREDLADARAMFEGMADAPERPLLVLTTTSNDPEHRTSLLGEGAAVVVGEQDDMSVLRSVLEEVVTRRASLMLLALKAKAASRYGTLGDFVAKSPRMDQFVKTVRKIAPQDSTVLILGETGVGKERLAHIIHEESSRASGPFVAVNCAALPEALLESELFGHDAGAFTDARKDRRGKFEIAHTGTIFLDEIGDMPLHLQSKLLRVLQEREVERLGSEAPFPIDVRVIAATNVSLKAAMEARTFRADLYFRLCVIELEIPPLSERVEDIPTLVETLAQKYADQFGRGQLRVSEAAMAVLVGYRWPGNIRELANVMERAALLVDGDEIEVSDLPGDITSVVSDRPSLPTSIEASTGQWEAILGASPTDLSRLSLPVAREELLVAFERWYLSRLLSETEGAIGKSAQRAGLDPRSMYEKLKRHGIDKRSFKRP